MKITAEISYYPLHSEFDQKIMHFLEQLARQEQVKVEIGPMSTVLQGEYEQVMQLINVQMAETLAKENAVFNLKISNSCEWKVNT